MKILVTGGAGFIGSELVRQAIGAGMRVVNVDALTYAAAPGTLDAMRENPAHDFVRADIRDRRALDRVFAVHAPDAVIHLAAESHVDRSIDGPGVFVDTNVTGTLHLLEAAREHWQARGRPPGFRFLHVSTDEVYGSLGPEGRFSEASSYAPNSPYSASKAAADHLARAWHATYGLPVMVTNCSNNYGPYQFPEKLIPLAILRAAAGARIPVYGDGANIRDWLHVEDHADALLAVLMRGRPGRSYAVGGGAEARNIDIVRMICRRLDARLPQRRPHERLIAFVADRPGHDQRYAIDASRIREELGWRPAVALEEGLARTVDWYLDNADWWQPLSERTGPLERLGRTG